MAIDMTALDAAINALIANPDALCDYVVGDKSVSRSQNLSQLMKLRENLSAVPQVELELMTLDSAIELNGADNTQYATPQ